MRLDDPPRRRRLARSAMVLATAAMAAAPSTTASGAALPGCVVPHLVGRTLAQIDYDALSSPPAERCQLGSVTVRTAGGQPEVVVSQTPRAGAHVAYATPVAVVLAPARRPAHPGRCHIFAGTDAVARSADFVVYRTYRETTAGAGPTLVVDWRACRRSTGARQTIFAGDRDDEGGYVDAGDFVVAGSFVGHTVDRFESKYTGGSDYRSIVVFDLARGRQTAAVDVGSTLGPGNDPPGAPPLADVARLAVNAAGVVAWVSGYPTGAIVYVHDSHGTRLVGGASAGGVTRLAVGPAAVTWVADGAPASAPIS